jgi:dihydropteroate synthase
VGDGYPVRLVGAINVSPESFYRESVAAGEEALRSRAEQMAAEGADMIDVGAMSTAPYLATAISEAEETRRLTSAIRVLRQAVALPVSADTTRSRVALAALEAGAAVINDVSGFRGDPAMADLAARRADGVVLMASDLLRRSCAAADAAGIPKDRVVLDPGIGFFRRAALSWEVWDCELLRRLAELRPLNHPLLIGLSRKSFIGKILGRPEPIDRLAGSLAATAVAVLNGAHIIRTHDVGPTRDAIRMAEALRPA